MKTKFFILLLTFSLVNTNEELKTYKNHRVVSINIENDQQLKEIQALEAEPGVN